MPDTQNQETVLGEQDSVLPTGPAERKGTRKSHSWQRLRQRTFERAVESPGSFCFAQVTQQGVEV